MQRKTKKLMAAFMAVLMVIGIMPMDWATKTVAAETTSPSTQTSYVLDASTLSADDFGGYDVKLAEDKTVGTDGFFTVYGAKPDAKNSLKDRSSNELKITADNGMYTQAVNLGGGLKTSGQAGIGFTLAQDAKVTIYATVKAVNATKFHLQYSKDGGAATTFYDMINNPAEMNKIETTFEAGTYLLGGDNGADIFYIEVSYLRPEYSLDSDTVDEALFGADTLLIADSTVGTEGFFGVNTLGGKVKRITGKNLVFGERTFANSFRMDGASNYSTGQATVSFTTTQPARVTVLAAGKNDTSSLSYNDGSNTVVLDKLVKDEIAEYTFELTQPGAYKLGSVTGVDFYSIDVKYIGLEEVNGNNIPLEVSDAGLAETTVGTNDFFTIMGISAKNKIQTGTLKYNGTEYAKKILLSGGAKTSGQATIKFTTAQTAKITVLAAAKSTSASALEYVKVGDSEFTAIGDLSYDGINEYVIKNVKPGSYYLGGTNGADIYSIKVEYDPVDEVEIPWDEVAAPVIGEVTVNADGQFVVPFEAVIDRLNGAQAVRVTMLENGYEVTTQTFKSQKDVAVFTPLWSGNYTFVAVAQRTGSPDKASAVVAKDNYVLAVKKPVIEMAQNMGNGQLYIDWLNIEDADNFTVEYKAADATDYTVADQANTAGNITLTGLTAGNYDVRITANRADGQVGVYTETITMTAEAAQDWNIAVIGSSQANTSTITTESGEVYNYKLETGDTAANKQSVADAVDITNTKGTLEVAAQASGKISDDEDGFEYYYTYINPNTENFKMSATFTITDTSLTPDNQSGFGIVATDMLGVNLWNAVDIYHKYFNSISSLLYSSKASNPCMRTVTGYNAIDTSNADGVERSNVKSNFKENAKWELGAEYTFTLEKTNDKFIATCNGETQEYADTSLLSVQEDGSICVGIMNSRKVGVKVSNITFEKSESTGVSGSVSDTRITPNATVYSTDTTGSTAYEYIYTANTAGNLSVTLDGNEIYNQNIEADQVVRVPATVKAGSNTFASTFTPSGSESELTSTKAITKSNTVTCKQFGTSENSIYVSPSGTEGAKGTSADPMDLATAVKYAQPGQVIILKDGAYEKSISIPRSVSGTEKQNITLMAENTGMAVFASGANLTVVGSYWHVYGITVIGAGGVGIQVSGNYNTIEMCNVKASGNSGIQISRSGSANNKAGRDGMLWPSYNLIKNCESSDNCDAGRNDADGFAAKLTCGNGNKFYGCIAHNNIDDGWDLYAKTVSGEIGSVVIENCVAYSNGWLTTDDTTAAGYVYGEGNGFKLGGGYLKGGHQLINSVSFNNGAKGVTSNSCPDCQIINCTIYGNSSKKADKSYSVGLNTKDSYAKEWVVKGLISMAGKDDTDMEDLIPFSLHSADNFIYDGSVSYNNQGVMATDDWFVNTNSAEVVPTRNADGTINMHDLLVLTEAAPANSGARLDTTSAAALSVQPAVKAEIGTKPEETTPEESKPTQPTTPEESKPTQSTVPDVSNPDNSEDTTNTGDSSTTALFVFMIIMSAAIAAGVYFFDKKKKALGRR
ncbi:MAG: right-handed parallel beta-helix repeat-containing protein [Eubacteriales bacterium]|nr:right-handed parallel beta-helix repeat-containing protein [Eubacteriales bacterium]